MRPAMLAVVLMIVAPACTGDVQPLGVTEPIRVRGGALRAERLTIVEDPEAPGPRVTALEVASAVVTLGQLGRLIAGRVTEDAYSVGLAFEGLGSGYWVAPVDALDLAYPGERSFSLDVDIGGGIPTGLQVLQIVAIDEAGRFGPVRELPLCVIDDAVPDALNACDPTIAPPAVVISLTWDAPVDLNFVIDTPDGKRVDARHPTTAYVEGGGTIPPEVLADPHVGRLSRDSNRACELDGRNAESLIFAEDPPEGTYLLYADLFDACGERGVSFAITTYRRRVNDDGTYALVQTDQRTGFIPALSARGGAIAPLYVGFAQFPE